METFKTNISKEHFHRYTYESLLNDRELDETKPNNQSKNIFGENQNTKSIYFKLSEQLLP